MSVSNAAAVVDVEPAALAALDAGDRRAVLDLVMQAYGTSVYRYCRAMLGDGDRAQDVLQQTFVQVYESLTRFERRCSLRTWVFSIARHRCLDELRVWRRWKQRAVSIDGTLEDGSAPVVADERNPEHDALADERRRVLARCLRKLSPRVRDAVVRRYMEGMPYIDISGISGEREGTLRVRVARALPVLRRCVERAGVRS